MQIFIKTLADKTSPLLSTFRLARVLSASHEYASSPSALRLASDYPFTRVTSVSD